MRRVLKLAALLGGLGALVWSMRDRIRIAIRQGETPDPDYQIIEPQPSDAQPTDSSEPPAEVADEEPDSPPTHDSDKAG